MFGLETLFSNIYGICVAILVLSVLVAVHEAGHLFMAKWSNVRVDIFSIGMGKAIWGIQKGETYYQVGRLPFGGFCGFGDEENPNDPDPRALSNSPLWARLLTVIGGSLFNIVFAYLIMILMFSTGFQEEQLSNTVYVPTHIFDPADNERVPSPAFTAGLRSGDKIIKIEDIDTPHFRAITLAISIANQNIKNITYIRNNITNTTTVHSLNDFNTGVDIIGVQPISPAIISEVITNNPAKKAGLKALDKFIMIDNQPITYFHNILEIVNMGEPFKATIERSNKSLVTTNILTITPIFTNNTWQIGIKANYPEYIPVMIKAKNISEVFILPYNYVKDTILQIYVSLTKLFSGKVNVQQNLSGPVRIISITGDIAQTFNYSLLMKFVVMLSLALAVFNLLPFPGLDGGHIILQTARSIFKENPFAEKIISAIEQAGIILLLTIAVFVLFNDIKNIFIVPKLPVTQHPVDVDKE